MSSPEPMSDPKGPTWTTPRLMLMGLTILVIAWLCSNLLSPPPPAPVKYELKSVSVPLAWQTVVLLDAVAEDTYYQLIKQELEPVFQELGQDERVCLLPIGPDAPLLKLSPWCTQQNRLSWWVLPDPPGPQASDREFAAFQAALPALRQELEDKEQRSADLWSAKQQELLGTLEHFLWQMSVPQYLDPKGSLGVLLSVTRQGDTAHTPTQVVIYSHLVEQPYANWERDRTLIPPAPSQLYRCQVKVFLFTTNGDQLLPATRAKWDPWFEAGHPDGVEWETVDMSSVFLTPPPAAESVIKVSHHLLPPVVQKPEFPDVTSVVNGSDRPLETNILEERQ